MNTVATIADRLLQITPSFETYYRVNDVLWEHLESDPDVIRLSTYHGLQSDLRAMHNVDRCACGSTVLSRLGGHSLILREAPKQVIRIRAQIHELEHTRDDIRCLAVAATVL